IVCDLREGCDCDFLAHRLPADLIASVGRSVRGIEPATRRLGELLRGPDWGHPMAASLMLAADPTWRPEAPLPRLAGPCLGGAAWAGLDLWGAHLGGAALTGADLRGATLAKAELVGTRLCGADLSGASLAEARATAAELRGANLTGVRAAGVNFPGA